MYTQASCVFNYLFMSSVCPKVSGLCFYRIYSQSVRKEFLIANMSRHETVVIFFNQSFSVPVNVLAYLVSQSVIMLMAIQLCSDMKLLFDS